MALPRRLLRRCACRVWHRRTQAPEDLLRQAGIDAAMLQRPENRIPFEQQQCLWRLALAAPAEQPFALQFARAIKPADARCGLGPEPAGARGAPYGAL